MTGYGGKELAAAHRTVRRNTVQIARDIPEDKYDVELAPGSRTVRQTLAHIASISGFHEDVHRSRHLSTLQGYDFMGFHKVNQEFEQKPRTKDELVKLLEADGEQFESWLESLSPEFLAETFTDASGQNPRTRLEGLLSAKEHEMHHRGQLMLMQRLLGITPHLTRARQQQQAAMAQAKK